MQRRRRADICDEMASLPQQRTAAARGPIESVDSSCIIVAQLRRSGYEHLMMPPDLQLEGDQVQISDSDVSYSM